MNWNIFAKFCDVTIPISPIFVKSGLLPDFQDKFTWFLKELLKNLLLCVTTRHYLAQWKDIAQNKQNNSFKSLSNDTLCLHINCTYSHRFDDVTGKIMTSAKKLLYQSIPLMIDNLCTKFHDVTISSSNVIEEARGQNPPPPPGFFTFKKVRSY